MLNKREIKVNLYIYFIFFITFVILIRLAYLQFLKHDYYTNLAKNQAEKVIEITNNRGIIFDRNGTLLASKKMGASLFLYGKASNDYLSLKNALRQAGIYMNPAEIKSISQTNGFRWLKRGIDLSQAYKLKENYPEVGIVKHEMRFYPYKNLSADIIGFTGIDNQGLFGVEYKLDSILKLKKTSFTALRDSRGNLISLENNSNSNEIEKKIYLSIDAQIQKLAEIILHNDAVDYRAKSAFAAAIDVYTGDIVFSASYPTFDLNRYYEYPKNLWKNKLAQFLFEPGSIFKPIIFSFLIENGLINENEIIYCENGSFKVGNHIFNDVHAFENLNIYDIVVHSSNIGMVKLANRIIPGQLYNYLKEAGFGNKTNVYGLTEEDGFLRPVKQWSRLSKYSISIGQEILVTPIQMLRFYSAIANDGFLVKPRVISRIDPDGYIDIEYRRLFSSNTSKVLKGILREVVNRGTGKYAKLPYLEVAGKTGTAQKFDVQQRRYSKREYVASFIGFFPVEHPKYAMIVIYDSPRKSIYGGSTAALTFKKIVEQIAILENLGNKQLVAKNEN
jgi:cell division protein FtsI (penicillin-binding protein 3)